MRKAINTAAFLFFVWLLLDAFNILGLLLNFLLVGAIPGTTVTLPANIMLGLIGIIAGIFTLEFLSRHVKALRAIRRDVLSSAATHSAKLPRRRYTQV